MEPESFATKTAFEGAIPASAAGYSATAHSAWTAAAVGSESTTPTASSGTIWADSTASTGTTLNKITKSVNNGDSFVIGIDADATVTWDSTAVPSGKALVRREQLDCASIVVGTCYPSYSFRMPQNAILGEVWYAAVKLIRFMGLSNLLLRQQKTFVQFFLKFYIWDQIDLMGYDTLTRAFELKIYMRVLNQNR